MQFGVRLGSELLEGSRTVFCEFDVRCWTGWMWQGMSGSVGPERMLEGITPRSFSEESGA
jgi:hypothetical protein